MKLNFKKIGSGNPVIIVHGLLGMLDNWIGIANTLSNEFSVYIVDLRNHGNSPHSDIFDYKVMADDLLEFIITNNINQPVMIGHSMGGKTCIKLAFENQNLLKKLIIIDICQKEYSVNKEISRIFEAILSLELSTVRSYLEVESQLESYKLNIGSLQLIIKNLKKSNNGFSWKSDITNIYKNLNYIRAGINSEIKVLLPTLFLRGQYSNFIMDTDYDLIFKNFPQAEILTVQNAGHWVHFDNKSKFITEVRRFVKQGT